MPRPHLDRIQLSATERAVAARLYKHVDVLAGLIGARHVWKYDYLMAAEKYVRVIGDACVFSTMLMGTELMVHIIRAQWLG